MQRHTEGRNDHDVVLGDAAEVELPVVGRIEELDLHLLEPAVHVRVVDDLAHEQDPPIRELAARLVCVVHRTVHAVAETGTLRETQEDPPGLKLEVPLPDEGDDGAPVLEIDHRLDLLLQTQPAPVIAFLRGRRLATARTQCLFRHTLKMAKSRAAAKQAPLAAVLTHTARIGRPLRASLRQIGGCRGPASDTGGPETCTGRREPDGRTHVNPTGARTSREDIELREHERRKRTQGSG